MAISTPNAQQVPVKIVGSSIFGRHPIISDERTYNLFISDDWLLNFAGYKLALEILGAGIEGRAIYHSSRGNFLLIVVGSIIYRIDPNFGFRPLFNMATSVGEVFIDENLNYQICIVDGTETAYIYNYDPIVDEVRVLILTGTPQNPFKFNYVCYQNSYFIFGNGNTDSSGSQWFVYQPDLTMGAYWSLEFVQVLNLQTKPDFAKACVRIPSYGNYLLVLGSTVAELWLQVPGIQVYQRQASINIDYGIASVSTIATSDDMVVWLGINQNSSPAIMVTQGGKAERISTDGIDYQLGLVKFPEDSTAMFYRQDGHTLYILTFFNPADNFSLMYDFTTQKFFDLTDYDFSYHPARQMVYFNNEIYFVSLKVGSLYIIGTDITTMSPDGINVLEIPRVRICDTYRLPGSDRFIVNQFSFTVENGVQQNVFTPADAGRIDVSISKNGGETYGNVLSYNMHLTGQYNNQPRFNKLGQANQFTIQMRFWGFGDINIANGVIEVYQ